MGNYKKNFIILITSWVLLIILVFIFFKYTVYNKEQNNTHKALIYVMEQAYFEGQKDALNKDIRIKYDSVKKSYIWIKSPWDSIEK